MESTTVSIPGLAIATGEKEVGRIPPGEPEPRRLINEPSDLFEERYSFRGGRIVQACGGVVLGLAGLGLVGLGFVGTDTRGAFFWGVSLAIGAVWLLWRSLHRPYEVRVAPSGLLRFASVTGRTDVCAADIVRIVKVVRVTNGALHQIRVKHRNGSVTLDGHEVVFARLAKLSRTALISVEEYNDTD